MLSDPNDLAFVLLFALSFSLSLLVRPKHPAAAAVGVAAVVLLIAAIIMTRSRGGLIGVIAVFTTFAWATGRLRSLQMGGVIALGGALFVIMGVGARSFSAADPDAFDESTGSRLSLMRIAIEMALHNPLFGVGMDAFQQEHYKFRQPGDGNPQAPHSIWLQVAAENGLPALVLYGLLFYRAGRGCIETMQRAKSGEVDASLYPLAIGLLGSIVGFACGGLVPEPCLQLVILRAGRTGRVAASLRRGAGERSIRPIAAGPRCRPPSVNDCGPGDERAALPQQRQWQLTMRHLAHVVATLLIGLVVVAGGRRSRSTSARAPRRSRSNRASRCNSMRATRSSRRV